MTRTKTVKVPAQAVRCAIYTRKSSEEGLEQEFNSLDAQRESAEAFSPETMMRAWQFPLEEFQQTLKRFEKTRPDPEKVKEYFGYITKQWDGRFRPRRPGDKYLMYRDVDDDNTEPDVDGEEGGTSG